MGSPDAAARLAQNARVVRDLEILTDRVTCRLVAEHALLHCKTCGSGERVLVEPRPDFLAAVRAFIHAHSDCAAA